MSKEIYSVQINPCSEKSCYTTLAQVKQCYNTPEWETCYIKKNGKRYLVINNRNNGCALIYSYDKISI